MLPYAWVALSLLAPQQLPPGTELHIRLTTPVGSYSSKPGSPVSAVLIAPVQRGDEVLLPEGSTLRGVVTHVERVGYGIVHETATLDLEFNSVTLPDGESYPVSTRVLDVDNSRERVTADGTIRGVRTTASISYRASGYIRTALCWEIHARLVFWAVKTLLVQVPEPEIYYPAGVELTLSLDDSIPGIHPEPERTADRLTEKDRDALIELTAGMPYRAYSKSKQPSDLVNLLFIGSQQQISTAFRAAGWTQASKVSMRARIRGTIAVIEDLGYRSAPMSPLFLGGARADMAWQKALNDVAKRHHVRLWKQNETWNGQQVWMAAATHDVDFAYLRRGSAVTHRIEENVDDERDKIVHDLQFTTCTDLADWWERPGDPTFSHNSTGDPMSTDGRLAVVQFHDCAAPRITAPRVGAPTLRAHGNGFQRIARRQILSVRSDYYRTNLYWRSYEGTRWVVTAIRRRHSRQEFQASRPKPKTLAGSLFTKAWNSSWFR